MYRIQHHEDDDEIITPPSALESGREERVLLLLQHMVLQRIVEHSTTAEKESPSYEVHTQTCMVDTSNCNCLATQL